MAQTWHDLLFAHWSVPMEQLRRLIPATIEIDTYEGQAWIGVVPFRMSGVRLRGTPSLPWFSSFPEMNVRTYVVVDGKPGVFFFSLDAGNPIAVSVARAWFHLPYFNARMSLKEEMGKIQYATKRKSKMGPSADFQGWYRPKGNIFQSQPGSLEHWLTERYCLYATNQSNKIYRAEIHHTPWPLQPAECSLQKNTMTQPLSIQLPETEPLLHFARRIDVTVWAPKRIF